MNSKIFNFGKIAFFGVLTTIAVATAPGFAADYNLRAVVGPDLNDEDYDGIVVFKDFVESRSNGAISVEIFAGTQLCANGRGMPAGNFRRHDGRIHIDLGGAAGIFPYVQIFDLPYLLRDDRVAKRYWRDRLSIRFAHWHLKIPAGLSGS